jgi:hypothetical protein
VIFCSSTKEKDSIPEPIIPNNDGIICTNKSGQILINKNKIPVDKASSKESEYTIYLIDQSGSMSATFGNNSRMEVVKSLTVKFIESLKSKQIETEGNDNADNFGLYTFGGLGCSCVQEIQSPFIPFKKSMLIKKVNNLQPVGLTPISTSIDIMAQLIKNEKGKFKITIITDGAESCGGLPSESAKRLLSLASFEYITLETSIIGLDLSRRESKEYEQISKDMGGHFENVDNPKDFSRAFGMICPYNESNIPESIIVNCTESHITLDNKSKENARIYHAHLLKDVGNFNSRKRGYDYFIKNPCPFDEKIFQDLNARNKTSLYSEEKILINNTITEISKCADKK